VLSKVEAAYQHCRRLSQDGRFCQKEAAYVGSRLRLLLVSVHQWKQRFEKSSVSDGVGDNNDKDVEDGKPPAAVATTMLFETLHDAVEEVYLCMEAAATSAATYDANDNDNDVDTGDDTECRKEDRTKWREKVKTFLDGTDLLVGIRRATTRLDAVLLDLNINQSNVVLEELQQDVHRRPGFVQRQVRYGFFDALLARIGNGDGGQPKVAASESVVATATDATTTDDTDHQGSNNNDNDDVIEQFLQKKVDQVLDEYNRETVELKIENNDSDGEMDDLMMTQLSSHHHPDSPTGSSHHHRSSEPTTNGSGRKKTNNEQVHQRWQQQEQEQQKPQPKVRTFHPKPWEIQALALDKDDFKCSYRTRHFLGGGTFSEVYLGRYKGKKVAVKCLKIRKRDFRKLQLSEEELQQDAERVQAEAALMARCGHSNIIEVIGCHAIYTEVERPIIVMQVSYLPTSSFDLVFLTAIQWTNIISFILFFFPADACYIVSCAS